MPLHCGVKVEVLKSCKIGVKSFMDGPSLTPHPGTHMSLCNLWLVPMPVSCILWWCRRWWTCPMLENDDSKRFRIVGKKISCRSSHFLYNLVKLKFLSSWCLITSILLWLYRGNMVVDEWFCIFTMWFHWVLESSARELSGVKYILLE